jgi:hypothetical protein
VAAVELSLNFSAPFQFPSFVSLLQSEMAETNSRFLKAAISVMTKMMELMAREETSKVLGYRKEYCCQTWKIGLLSKKV